MASPASTPSNTPAAPQTTQHTGSPSADEFVPVQGGGETTSAEGLLVTAYAIMWLLALVFVLLTWKKQNRLDRRLGALESALRDRSPDRSDAGGPVP